MTELISKIQYKNFEVGEFIKSAKRDYFETISLIENFPWNKEREKIVIDLTNPSITIEGKNNNFLKLALFFNNKFVLHYFNQESILYTKSFIKLNETYPYIKSYFESVDYDLTDFKQENTWLQHNLKHFVSQDFRYFITEKSIREFLLRTSGINLGYSVFVILLFAFKGINNINFSGALAILLTMFVFGGGINLLLFFNYYFYTKDKILIMSKGNDIFYYGNKDSPIEYDKKNINQYTTIKNRGTRSPITGFAIVEIEFKDINIIKIPSILVNSYKLEEKLFQYPKIDKNGFPFLRI